MPRSSSASSVQPTLPPTAVTHPARLRQQAVRQPRLTIARKECASRTWIPCPPFAATPPRGRPRCFCSGVRLARVGRLQKAAGGSAPSDPRFARESEPPPTSQRYLPQRNPHPSRNAPPDNNPAVRPGFRALTRPRSAPTGRSGSRPHWGRAPRSAEFLSLRPAPGLRPWRSPRSLAASGGYVAPRQPFRPCGRHSVLPAPHAAGPRPHAPAANRPLRCGIPAPEPRRIGTCPNSPIGSPQRDPPPRPACGRAPAPRRPRRGSCGEPPLLFPVLNRTPFGVTHCPYVLYDQIR